MSRLIPLGHSASFIPLSVFEKELLIELNVAPTQLHPNSWAFIRGFVVLCSQFEISLTVDVFFYIFSLKILVDNCGCR